MHENVRLCVECNRQSRSCPVKRLRSSGAERARAAISGAPAGPSGLERECRAPQQSRAGSKLETSTGAMFSSSQAGQFRAPWRSRASSNGHVERPRRAERARAAISSAPAEPSGLDVGSTQLNTMQTNSCDPLVFLSSMVSFSILLNKSRSSEIKAFAIFYAPGYFAG
jgi:hypothetical protein